MVHKSVSSFTDCNPKKIFEYFSEDPNSDQLEIMRNIHGNFLRGFSLVGQWESLAKKFIKNPNFKKEALAVLNEEKIKIKAKGEELKSFDYVLDPEEEEEEY